MASVTEKDALVTSLQEELREAREKATADGVRLSLLSSGLSTNAALLLITSLIMFFWVFLQGVMGQLTAFQTEAKETLQALFPQIPVETEQVGEGDFDRRSF